MKHPSYLKDLHARLIVTEPPDPRVRIFVVATGGGAGLQHMLWSVPGSSAYLAGAAFPYSTSQIDEFLGFAPKSYCSADTALQLAMEAYYRAWEPSQEPTHTIGLAITASVASSQKHRGDHRVFAAAFSDIDSSWSPTECELREVTLRKDVGWDARANDGAVCDLMGLNVLFSLLRMPHVPLGSLMRTAIDHYAIRDGVGDARRLFFERGHFNAIGTRTAAPDPPYLLFPGAFNPPHDGHMFSARMAEALSRLQPTVFHITADPPHKPRLTVPQMLQRAKLLRGNARLFSEGDALYIEKARRHSGLPIVVGADALLRMLDPSWGPEILPMLEEFQKLNTHFYVTSRKMDTEIVDLDSLPIPVRFRPMFTDLGRGPDLSSTSIRNGTHVN